jgi:predicted RecA/RadA family phage recombinase
LGRPSSFQIIGKDRIMDTFVQPGHQVSVPAPANVTSGQGVLVGSLFGVAGHDALSGADVELALEGVYRMAKATGAAWTVGARLYWDDTAKNLTTTASTNKLVGVATVAAGSADTTGIIRLSSAFTL